MNKGIILVVLSLIFAGCSNDSSNEQVRDAMVGAFGISMSVCKGKLIHIAQHIGYDPSELDMAIKVNDEDVLGRMYVRCLMDYEEGKPWSDHEIKEGVAKLIAGASNPLLKNFSSYAEKMMYELGGDAEAKKERFRGVFPEEMVLSVIKARESRR